MQDFRCMRNLAVTVLNDHIAQNKLRVHRSPTGTFMNSFIILGLTIPWLVVGLGCWLGWQLLRQNGRMLLRLEALEQRLADREIASEPGRNGKSQSLTRSRLTRDGLKAG